MNPVEFSDFYAFIAMCSSSQYSPFVTNFAEFTLWLLCPVVLFLIVQQQKVSLHHNNNSDAYFFFRNMTAALYTVTAQGNWSPFTLYLYST